MATEALRTLYRVWMTEGADVAARIDATEGARLVAAGFATECTSPWNRGYVITSRGVAEVEGVRVSS